MVCVITCNELLPGQMPRVLHYETDLDYLQTAYNGLVHPRLRLYSVMCNVLTSSNFYIFSLFHLAIFYAARSGKLQVKGVIAMEWDHLKILSAVTTFFAVYYSNLCWSQYTGLYTKVVTILRSACGLVMQVHLQLSPVSRGYAWMVSRYLLVVLLLFFHEQRGHKVSENEWRKLVDGGLLRLNEAEVLQCQNWTSRQNIVILLHWCAEFCRLGFRKGSSARPQLTAGNALPLMTNPLLDIHGKLMEVRDNLDLQIPYPYFHLLHLMMVLNLSLWAYAMGIEEKNFAPAVFVLASVIFMGLVELAQQLSLPFGDDEVDFPVEEWLCDLAGQLFTIAGLPEEDDTTSWQCNIGYAQKSVKTLSRSSVCNFFDEDRDDVQLQPERSTSAISELGSPGAHRESSRRAHHRRA